VTAYSFVSVTLWEKKMRRTAHRVAGLAVLVCVASGLVACGDNSDSGNTATGASSTPPTTATAPSSTAPTAGSTEASQSGGGDSPWPVVEGSDYNTTYALTDIPNSGVFAEPQVSGDQISYDMGNGTSITITKGSTPKIAVFMASTVNEYYTVMQKYLKDELDANGWSAEFFDANFTPTTQYDQIASALSNNKYNVFMVLGALDSTSCKLLSDEAPAKNILVIVGSNPACGLGTKEMKDEWAPGTMEYIGGQSSPEAYYTALELGLAKGNYTGDQKVIGITGPEGYPAADAYVDQMEKFQADHPEIKFLDIARIPYTAEAAQTAAEQLLVAHPDATLIYNSSLPGNPPLVTAARAHGGVKVLAKDCDKFATPFLESGDITSCGTLFPAGVGRTAALVLEAAYNGQQIPRIIYHDGYPLTPASITTPPYLDVLTKDNYKDIPTDW
jgi:ribose transport system substrate-binding protein